MPKIHVCDGDHPHHSISNMELPSDASIGRIADLFKIFGDPTRVRILFTLSREELCVCDLAEALGMTQSATSHQLRVLKQSYLVKSRREGKAIFYSLADDHVSTILKQGLDHVEE